VDFLLQLVILAALFVEKRSPLRIRQLHRRLEQVDGLAGWL
jgi:hypothetical protein